MSPLATGFIAVGSGAALGAWLRWGLSWWLNERLPAFPLGTFVANAVGGLLVGLAVAWFAGEPNISPAWRLFIVTGFLGGLTTFSTYSAEVVGLMAKGEMVAAVLLALAHLAVSFALTALGWSLLRQS